MGSHLIDGQFQSDKYPTTPRGKVPLSVSDVTAQDLLWVYAQRRRKVDAEFSDDLETALRAAGFEPPSSDSLENALELARFISERVYPDLPQRAGGDEAGEKAGLTQASESLANPSPPPPARPEGREEPLADLFALMDDADNALDTDSYGQFLKADFSPEPDDEYTVRAGTIIKVNKVFNAIEAIRFSALPRARETQSEDVDVRAEDGSGGPGQTQKGTANDHR